jgi:hypothetical protein
MSLLIAMPGPLLPETDAMGLAQSRAVLPEMPALTCLLARSRRLPSSVDWRAGALGALQGARVPQVAVAAGSLGEACAGAGACFVSPLHMVAGISRVHLPEGGRLVLEAEERAAWREEFNREFGNAELRLHATAEEWVLTAPFAAAARDAAPEQLLGEPLMRAPAASAAERALRRLGAEVEMWLAAHPRNREREQRRSPPINGFWFWGGGQVAADWRSAAGAQWIVLGSQSGVPTPEQWRALEADWFEPAWRAVRSGAIKHLRLQIGRNAWQLPDRSPLRWFRRARPWWQAWCA